MNLSSLDLNLLRVLDALLKEGSTVRAGARIGLSQPAVSAALKRLRHALGDDLFLRRGQGLEPTDYARALAVPLDDALNTLQAVLAGAESFDPARADRTFTVACDDLLAEMLMPALAEMLSRRAPGMSVRLVGQSPVMDLETLERHRIDIAFTPAVPAGDWVDHRPVMKLPFKVIARSGHPRFAEAGLAPGDTVPLDLYCDLGHVLFSNDGSLTGIGDLALARVGRARRVVMAMPFFSGVLRSVAGTDLVALVPGRLADAAGLGLDVYAPPVPVDPVRLSMFWHKRATATPAHGWLRARIVDILRPSAAVKAGRYRL